MEVTERPTFDSWRADARACELARGAAIVTATHDISEAIEYDQVLLLARRVVALGPGAEVLSCEPIPAFLLDMVEAGGLMNQLKRRLENAT